MRPQIVIVTVLLALLWIGVMPAPTYGKILQQQEGPHQILYQSRQTLKDTTGTSWQAIAFKRIQPDGDISLSLRLVGFPGAVALHHPQSLTIVTSLGQKFTAPDITDRIFTSEDISNVGQYDLQTVIADLRPEIPIKLSLGTQENATVEVFVPSPVIQEWVTVAARG